ncbi:hypothetical protein DIJ64_14455 [Mycobacterium leprae]|uniref:Uncharacterized protein n=1 Tax=Mycobacterium leprae TaxID=1769 RepID=A0AAD0KU67_MYCLR|nr:hypothetical protein DIJ64_14455 [Mycobacterium leprae]OAR21263.1 hypothetical protein A8144_07385 [Mycobacterium leprae 3125609]
MVPGNLSAVAYGSINAWSLEVVNSVLPPNAIGWLDGLCEVAGMLRGKPVPYSLIVHCLWQLIFAKALCGSYPTRASVVSLQTLDQVSSDLMAGPDKPSKILAGHVKATRSA